MSGECVCVCIPIIIIIKLKKEKFAITRILQSIIMPDHRVLRSQVLGTINMNLITPLIAMMIMMMVVVVMIIITMIKQRRVIAVYKLHLSGSR